MAKNTIDDELDPRNNRLSDSEPEETEVEEEDTPTWFDYWETIFTESIGSLIGIEDDYRKIDAHELALKAKDIADEALKELQYKQASMELDETEPTEKVQ